MERPQDSLWRTALPCYGPQRRLTTIFLSVPLARLRHSNSRYRTIAPGRLPVFHLWGGLVVTEHLRKPADLFCYDNFSDGTVKCLSQTIFVCEPLGQDLRGLRVRYAI
jgi:hypothetical protein